MDHRQRGSLQYIYIAIAISVSFLYCLCVNNANFSDRSIDLNNISRDIIKKTSTVFDTCDVTLANQKHDFLWPCTTIVKIQWR